MFTNLETLEDFSQVDLKGSRLGVRSQKSAIVDEIMLRRFKMTVRQVVFENKLKNAMRGKT